MYGLHAAKKKERVAEEQARIRRKQDITEDSEAHHRKTDVLADRYCRRVYDWIAADEQDSKPQRANEHTSIHNITFRDRVPSKELGAMRPAPNAYVLEKDRIASTIQRDRNFIRQPVYKDKGLSVFRQDDPVLNLGPPQRYNYMGQEERVAKAHKQNQELTLGGPWVAMGRNPGLAQSGAGKQYSTRAVESHNFVGAALFQTVHTSKHTHDHPGPEQSYCRIGTKDFAVPYNVSHGLKPRRDQAKEISTVRYSPNVTEGRYFYQSQRVPSYEWNGHMMAESESRGYYRAAKEIFQGDDGGEELAAAPTRVAKMENTPHMKSRARAMYEHRYGVSDGPRRRWASRTTPVKHEPSATPSMGDSEGQKHHHGHGHHGHSAGHGETS